MVKQYIQNNKKRKYYVSQGILSKYGMEFGYVRFLWQIRFILKSLIEFKQQNWFSPFYGI